MPPRTSRHLEGQLGLPGVGYENRSLFSENFLEHRLPQWQSFQEIDPTPIADRLADVWRRERATIDDANESQTEDRLIQPILDILGFERTVQPSSRLATGRRIPDYALFTSLEDRQASEGSTGLARFLSAVALAEAKRFGTALDKRGAGAGPQEDPEAQILDYMWRTRVKWAILTNGKEWRLYGQAGDLVEAAHFSVPDLPSLIEARDLEQLRYFIAFFSAESFRTDETGGNSFLEQAFAESEANAKQIGESLRDQMFNAVPRIAEGLLGEDERNEQNLRDAFENSLVILYRLLFCLYAESRNLLPVDNPGYREYGLKNNGSNYLDVTGGSMRSSRLFNDLDTLFDFINAGEVDLGINEYNGGLFSEEGHPWLIGRTVPDPLMRQAVAALLAIDGEMIDYRDLSIRHLGTMYEQLLEFRLSESEGRIILGDAGGRHETGSYFTPEPIVDAIVERTLDPILGEISEQVQEDGLTGDDAIERFLDVSVCDPAMGSGHFLVSAAAYVSRFIATDPSQEGEDIEELEIRRKVAERCLYGVDLNPMAVELARLALWLSTVDGSRPLTFLTNLRAGNSLVGADVDDLRQDITYWNSLTTGIGGVVERDAELHAISSESADDVHEKASIALAAERARTELETFADDQIRPYFTDDPQAFHWQIEFPEIFFDADGNLISGGGFDAIVGNPPYVRIQALGREMAAWCRRVFESAHGSFDLYIVFIERAFGLLASRGRLGFIVPNKFMKLDSGQRLRGMLAQESVVHEVVDFGDIQVFEGATNYTCIISLVSAPADAVDYIRVPNDGRTPLSADLDRAPVERFDGSDLGDTPWILVTAPERDILRTASRSSEPLESCTSQIFQGLITSADPVYILEDLGPTPHGCRVYSRASRDEVILEPDLLHPLASGRDVDRWALRPLKELLLFPYHRVDGEMELLKDSDFEHLPRTHEYLLSHEQQLRGRERDRMDHEGWYGYVYPKSLGLHQLPKLGVPRLVDRLHTAVDANGDAYLDNVDVNGVVPSDEGPNLWILAALLNTRLLDYIFKRGSVPFRGSYFSANKQFIAPLPIKIPDVDQANRLEDLAKSLHEATSAKNLEMDGFKSWLGVQIGVPLNSLKRHTHLGRYPELGHDGVLDILRQNRRLINANPDSRSFQEQLSVEVNQSLVKLADFNRVIVENERELEAAVFDLYGLSSGQRETVNAEYD